MDLYRQGLSLDCCPASRQRCPRLRVRDRWNTLPIRSLRTRQHDYKRETERWAGPIRKNPHADRQVDGGCTKNRNRCCRWRL